jgi:hypothetical protein
LLTPDLHHRIDQPAVVGRSCQSTTRDLRGLRRLSGCTKMSAISELSKSRYIEINDPVGARTVLKGNLMTGTLSSGGLYHGNLLWPINAASEHTAERSLMGIRRSERPRNWVKRLERRDAHMTHDAGVRHLFLPARTHSLPGLFRCCAFFSNPQLTQPKH